MPRVTRKDLELEIERSGKIAKFSPRAIDHVKEAVKSKTRLATYSITTKNGYKHPLVLAGIIDARTVEVTDNPFVKSDAKVDKFLEIFEPGDATPLTVNAFVTVV